MFIYRPNPIRVPDSTEVVRQIVPETPFTEQEKKRIDTRTLFYDVFKDPHSRQLRAVGPLWFNLKRELMPMQIRVNGKRLNYRLVEIERVAFLETEDMPEDVISGAAVEFRFSTFSATVDLNWTAVEAELRNHAHLKLTMSTLQKENPFEWIKDWLQWHVRLHGVQRLILYDNGSTDRDALVDRLPELEGDAAIVFVDWPYRYGVPPHEYAQQGSLNHTRLAFPVRGSYCVNLDIDEYLVKRSSGSLVHYLSSRLGDSPLGAVAFSQRLVPNISDSRRERLPRLVDFPYRFKNAGYSLTGESWNEIGRMKYIYHFDKIGYNATHRTASEKNKEFSMRYSALHRAVFLFRKILRELLGKVIGDRLPKVRIDACHAPPDELFFYHFLGLNTGWNDLPLIKRIEFDKTIHVSEPLIRELAERAQLDADSD